MQTQRLWRGIAVLALGLVLIWGMQATFAAPGGGDGANVEQANNHKPDHEQGSGGGGGGGNGNGGGPPADAGPPENPGNSNGNGNADPGPPDNPGNGNGNAEPGPPENPGNGNGNGNAAPPAQSDDEEDEDRQAQGPSDKVLVCHVTSSANNPSQLIEVSENAVPAHEAHGDAVGDEAAEACEEDGDAPPEGTPDGSPVASPVAPGHKVLVCHATSSDDNPLVLIEIDEHAVPAHEAHGDIVDVESAEDCTAGTPVASPVASDAEGDDD